MPSAAASWATFVAENQRAFEGALEHQRLRDRADFVIVPPGGPFYLGASGYVTDGCASVNRFAIASATPVPASAASRSKICITRSVAV